jgi:hypothetical protein
MKSVQFAIIVLLIFSVWVAFALLAVNPYLHPYVPGYQVGKPCGWEFVALFASVGIAYFWTRNWSPPTIEKSEAGSSKIILEKNLLVFLLVYLGAAVAIFLWQYSIFSASFN